MYSLKAIYLFTLLVSIEWEYITPLYLSRSVSDPMDIVAYFLGVTLYYFVCKKFKIRVLKDRDKALS